MFRKDVLVQLFREEIRSGEKIAQDRKNNILPDLALLKTTIRSGWWVKKCPVCRDLFRENDLVRICPVCKQAYHDDAAFNLRCWGNHFSAGDTCLQCHEFTWNGILPAKEFFSQTERRPFPLMEEQFFTGLLSTWKTFGNAPIRIVRRGDLIIGNRCHMCRYKFREGDRVVKCPCSSSCEEYFHSDILRDLTCWNEWNGELGKNYCPVSSKEYEVKTRFKKLF
ncbi:hypothetical protein Q4E93_20955 [Flavitalea sp. BT771]|uniref:hypothetical protein n=1 Tax=Flavitalea sp. BT771 TaxID=3063329 RepID=UPI0026E31C68|nr:hypothetical protein [Flavitalea sp. BT771]MDO6433091.1 hypothetical protein [Flavitalea sp. BT771]MDV6221633.1 hypothetical protein [Flavitalea sp. BT771]